MAGQPEEAVPPLAVRALPAAGVQQMSCGEVTGSAQNWRLCTGGQRIGSCGVTSRVEETRAGLGQG